MSSLIRAANAADTSSALPMCPRGISWHLAPLLLAAAAPWVVAQDLRAGDRRALPRLAGAVVTGLLVSVLVGWGLAAAGLLRGPTLPGFADPRAESLLLAGAGAVLAALLGARRALRRPPATRSAWLGDHLIARSDDVVLVEGNAYFPTSDVQPGALVPSSTRTVCPWKGIARYHSLALGGTGLRDVAWSCSHPLPLARRVKGRIAFRDDIEIRTHDPDALGSRTSPPRAKARTGRGVHRRIGWTSTTGTEQRWTSVP